MFYKDVYALDGEPYFDVFILLANFAVQGKPEN